jgi:hypothetical protein
MAEMTKKTEQRAEPSLPPPTARALARAAEAKGRNKARQKRVSVDVTQAADTAGIRSPHNDDRAWTDTLLDAFGTTSLPFVRGEVERLANSLRNAGDARISPDVVNASLAVIDGTQPENEMAAMLAVQMVATHALAIDMLGRTRRAETLDHLNAFGGLATKLLRASASLTEALARLKRGGEQTVRVEHVHVLGPVTHHGGRASPKTQDQSHAKQIAYAPLAPMLGKIEAERPTVPFASRPRS